MSTAGLARRSALVVRRARHEWFDSSPPAVRQVLTTSGSTGSPQVRGTGSPGAVSRVVHHERYRHPERSKQRVGDRVLTPCASTVNGERPERTIISCLLESFLADVRYSLRWLRKSPGFTLVAVASLAIGIGFNTALFTIVDALLFKPLPVAAPDRLVDIFTSASGFGPFSTSSYPDYLDLRAQNDVFEDIAGYSPMFAALNLDNRSRLAMGEIVTGNYFQVLGVGGRARPDAPAGGRPSGRRTRRDGLLPLLAARAGVRLGRRRPHRPHPRKCRTPSSASRRPASTAWCRFWRRSCGFPPWRRSRSNRSACTTRCRRPAGRRGWNGAAIGGCSCAGG